MALVSPGVQVTVIDQSNYAPQALGSVAYILLATAENKVAPGGTAIAAGTLPENALKELKEGTVTEFKNGQSWTLKNGSAVRIK